jgi:hypothetical protein
MPTPRQVTLVISIRQCRILLMAAWGVNRSLISNFKTEKNILSFNKELLEGTRIDLTYDCQD